MLSGVARFEFNVKKARLVYNQEESSRQGSSPHRSQRRQRQIKNRCNVAVSPCSLRSPWLILPSRKLGPLLFLIGRHIRNQDSEANPLTESVRPRIPKVAAQAETGEDGSHLISLWTPRVLLQARGIPGRSERP